MSRTEAIAMAPFLVAIELRPISRGNAWPSCFIPINS